MCSLAGRQHEHMMVCTDAHGAYLSELIMTSESTLKWHFPLTPVHAYKLLQQLWFSFHCAASSRDLGRVGRRQAPWAEKKATSGAQRCYSGCVAVYFACHAYGPMASVCCCMFAVSAYYLATFIVPEAKESAKSKKEA